MRILKSLPVAILIVLCLSTPSAHAQWAVVDVSAIAQLVQQIQVLQQQLTTARSQLDQARRHVDAVTGPRGMERLLADTQRHYLPSDWQALTAALNGAASEYAALASSADDLVRDVTVIPRRDLDRLARQVREPLEHERRSIASVQAVTRMAARTASARFDRLQSLIDAIPSARDAKAVMDLQARIAAETVMLQNESAKLAVMFEAARAEQMAERHRLRERAIADLGSLRDLPPMGLLDAP